MSNSKSYPKMADLERAFDNKGRKVNAKKSNNKDNDSQSTNYQQSNNLSNSKGANKNTNEDTKGDHKFIGHKYGKGNNVKYAAKNANKFTPNRKPATIFNLADDPSITDLEYKSVKSRQQFASLWKVPAAKEALLYILSKTMRDITIRANIANIIERYTNKPNSDELIYAALNAEYNKKQHNTDMSSITKYRIDARIRDLAGIVPQYNRHPKSYLDFGGGDGTISEGIAQWLGVAKDNAVSADVETWLSGTQAQKQLSGITFNTIPKAGRLPYKDGQFDAITCFVVLHHIEQLEERISELYRILAPGGWLLIREHDCRDNATRTIIDIYHNLFELVYNKSPNYKQVLDDYYGDYKTKEQWHFLMYDVGFENLDGINYPDIKADDLMRIYYHIYTKK